MTDAVTRYLQDTRRAATRTAEAATVSRIGQVMGLYQGLPELRGFWPYSSINEAGAAMDLSGQGRTLTNNGGVVRVVQASGLPICQYNGSTQFWDRASEAGLNITGALTILAWFNASTTDAVARYLVQNNGYGLYLYNGSLSFSVFGATTGYTAVGSAASSTWRFVAARFIPSTSVKITLDGTTITGTATIPATLNTGAAAFQTGTSFAGNMALLAICAAALPDALVSQIYAETHGLFGV